MICGDNTDAWPESAKVLQDLLVAAGPSVKSLTLDGDLGYFKNDHCFNVLRDTDCLSHFKSSRYAA
ncbi:hypothetical protein C8J56DRAFT_1064026 [Mycena floridula]|nr:hypothetical protein C8J56DRAFT_1064026 [Mycena floridula]